MANDVVRNRSTRLFIFLSGIFIANVFIAEFIGVKIFSLESTLGFEKFSFSLFGKSGLSFDLTAGVLLWPVVFIMTDVINEYFGMRGVRMLSVMAAVLILYAFGMFYAGIYLVPASWWPASKDGIENMDTAFNAIFGQGLWIIAGSLIAFLIGQIVDVRIFHLVKRLTGERKVWLRATGSTLISQFIDSYVVLFVAFYIGAGWDWRQVLAIGMVNYIYKFIMAIGLTPLIYLAHYLIDGYLGKYTAIKLKKQAAASSG